MAIQVLKSDIRFKHKTQSGNVQYSTPLDFLIVDQGSTYFETWNSQIQGIVNSINNNLSTVNNFCQGYKANQKYQEGSYIYYNNQLYYCTSTVQKSTNWDNDKRYFQRTTISDQLTNLFNNKLDKPANGTVGQVLTKTQYSVTWSDFPNEDVISTAAAQAVASWMSDNLTIPENQSYILDDSLTLTTAAAQAKATGDAINSVVKVSVQQPDDNFNKVWIHDIQTGAKSVFTQEEIQNIIAPAYTIETSYKEGDYVIYNGAMYCITVDIDAEENTTWDDVSKKQISVGEQVNNLNEQVKIIKKGETSIDLTKYEVINCTISSTNTILKSGNTYKSYQIPADMYGSIIIIASSQNTMISFLKTAIPNDISNGTNIADYFATGENGRHVINAGDTQEFLLSNNVKYFFITKNSNGNDYSPANITVKTRIESKLSNIDTSNIVNFYEAVSTIIEDTVTETKIDATLTHSNEAADAKVVGDAIGDLKSALDATLSIIIDKSESLVPASLTSGYWRNDHTTNTKTTKYKKTVEYALENGGVYIYLPLPDYTTRTYAWREENGTYTCIADSGWTKDPFVLAGGEDVTYAISFDADTGVSIDSSLILSNLQFYRMLDIASISSIAPAYSASATYALGDYCTKNGYFYRCNTPISTAEAWTAAHWTKVTVSGEINRVRNDTEILANGEATLDIANYDSVNCTVSDSVTAAHSASAYKSRQIPAEAYSAVSITADSEHSGVVTFLKTAIPPDIAGGADLSGYLATGETGRHVISAGNTEMFDLPSDTKYIFVTYTSNYVVSTPAVKVYTKVGADVAEIKTNIVAAVDDLTADVEKLLGMITDYETVDISKYSAISNVFINSSNKWASSNSVACKFVPVPSDTVGIRIKAKQEAGTVYAFLTDTARKIGTTPSFYGNTRRTVMSAGDEIETEVPDGVKYLYVYTKGNAGDVTPSYVAFNRIENLRVLNEKLDNIKAMVENQLWHQSGSDNKDVPENKGILNFVRKANQLTNLKWTPIAAVPHRTGTFTPGTQVTGVPYSSVKELMKYVGKQVSIRTFMTAVHNPYSLLYTENTSAANSTSGYGFTYHGKNCAAYYGMVCSSLQSYSLGINAYWDTYQFEYLARNGFLEKIYDQSADGVKLGDIYWKHGHTRIITSVTRNEYNEVTNITMREATGTTRQVISYTAASFNEKLANENGILYRYQDVYKNLSYEPSPFIPVLNEQAETYVYNDDICTYAGDYAAFRCGESVWINYTKGTYTGVEIYKDNTLVTTLTLDASADVHKIDVTSYTGTYGYYKARLTDGTNASDYTYWQMIDAQVSVTKTGTVLDVVFSASNAMPQSCMLTNLAGVGYVTYEFSPEEISAGHVKFDAVKLYAEQKNGSEFTSTTYIKVLFQGEYGAVINGLLDTGLHTGADSEDDDDDDDDAPDD